MRDRCESFIPLIVRSAEGTLAPDQRRELDAHIGSCSACAGAVRDQAVARDLLGQLELVPGSPDFAAQVRARIVAQPGVIDLFNWRSWTLRLAPVAAMLALLASYSALGDARGRTSSTIIDEWTRASVGVAGLLVDPGVSGDALLAAGLQGVSQ